MKTGTSAAVRLKGHCNNYSWGKMGHNSEVARLFQAGHKDFAIEDCKPYSELWMGTHPDGPARIMENTDEKLSSYIATTRTESNNNLRKESQSEVHLPFIMKVMSIERTLSLQVHPTKEQAARLHDIDPVNYPDRNHKPELAYALTTFQLLCGFRPPQEMLANLSAFGSLRKLFGPAASELEKCLSLPVTKETQLRGKELLKECFTHMMNFSKLDNVIMQLFHELDCGARGAVGEATVEVIRRMAVDFPGDVGVFSPLYLNHMILQPGECCYYAAEELHAYISGECVECVGCSNNTIRAAMTPKYIDRDNLIDVLNYQMTDPEDYKVPPQMLKGYHSVDEYAPDCRDFQLHRIRVKHGEKNVSVPPLDCGSIIVVTSGRAVLQEEPSASTDETYYVAPCQEVRRGDILYIHPGKRLRFISCTEDLEAFRTFSYEEGPDHENRTVVGVRHLNGIDFEPIRSSSEVGSLSPSESGIFEVDSEMDGFM